MLNGSRSIIGQSSYPSSQLKLTLSPVKSTAEPKMLALNEHRLPDFPGSAVGAVFKILAMDIIS